MTTKSYSKHKEFKEYSSSGNIPYADEAFDMMKSELVPKGSKLETFGNGTAGHGAREYHYEYKEEKHPSGKYDRKDLHTVEQYTIPPKTLPKASESSSYYYEREERELPAITSGTRTYNYESSTPGYSKVKSSKVTKDLSQNVEELDSLLDDLQKDQERQLYKNGYTSDTAESSSFDYKRGTPVKAPSSGYSTLKREERMETSSWGSSPPPVTRELRQEVYREEKTGVPSSVRREERLEASSWNAGPAPVGVTRAAEVRQEVFREEKTESRVVPATLPAPLPVAAPQQVCTHCHHVNTGTLSRSSTPMNKVTTTVKTYTYEVPADQDPTTVPIPTHADHTHTQTHSHTHVAGDTQHTSSTLKPAPSPALGCQYCSHCNSRVREYRHVTDTELASDRVLHPVPATQTVTLPEPSDGRGPYGPSSYKYTETSYSSHNTTERYPGAPPAPHVTHLSPANGPGPFPRPTTPSPGNQQPPKRLDDLLADFPEARFPTQPDGVVRRKVEVSHETHSARDTRDGPARPPPSPAPAPAPASSKNVAGPAVYYPPGHTPFAKKPETQLAGYQASSAMQGGGGAYASGRGMYEYESGARSKQKHSETKTAVPVCLPLCCAMPCVIM